MNSNKIKNLPHCYLKMIHNKYLIITMLSLIILNSCAINKSLNPVLKSTNKCNLQNAYHYTVQDIPQPLSTVSVSGHLKSKLSPTSIKMAHALGILKNID